MTNQKSSCCNSDLRTHYGDESTNYYYCGKCKRPCDPATPREEEVNNYRCDKCFIGDLHKARQFLCEDKKCGCSCPKSKILPATEELGHIDFLQTGNLHCFGCHKDFPPDTHFDECEIKEKTPYGCEKCKDILKTSRYADKLYWKQPPATERLKENWEEELGKIELDNHYSENIKSFISSQIKKAEERCQSRRNKAFANGKKAERERILAEVEKLSKQNIGEEALVYKTTMYEKELKALLTEK